VIANVPAYHTNTQEKCDDFLKNGTFIEYEDIYWLGTGMYFWDNFSNAFFWFEEKKKKGEGTTFIIIEARLIIEDMLDFTDLNTLEEFNELWKKFCKMKKNVNYKSPLGKKINYIFGYFDFLKDKKFVIKANASYPYTPRSRFIEGSDISNKTKTIYCVQSDEFIDEKNCLGVYQ